MKNHTTGDSKKIWKEILLPVPSTFDELLKICLECSSRDECLSCKYFLHSSEREFEKMETKVSKMMKVLFNRKYVSDGKITHFRNASLYYLRKELERLELIKER